MKKFLIRLIWFLILPVAIALTIELSVLFIPNTFNIKERYVKEHLDIELLILGSSHNQNAINPTFLDHKAANLAYGDQDISLDTALFFSYAPDLDELKYLILEIDYFTLEFKQDKNYFRLPWYYKYHGIEIYSIGWITKLSMYSSNPDFFNSYLLRKLNPMSEQSEINEYGFVTKGNLGEFYEMSFDTIKIVQESKDRLKRRHKEISLKSRTHNKNLINSIITYCEAKNIEVIIVSSPMYKTYHLEKLKMKEEIRINFIDSLTKYSTNVTHLDYESDHRFTITDFKDDDHLNPKGAKKFTQLLNRDLNSLYNSNECE